MREEWKIIIERPIYSVSNFGNVKNNKTGLILKPFKVGSKGNQYYAVDIYPKKSVRVHRLVASAFIPNPYNNPEVNHKNGNHFNNSVDNLEWVTGSENCTHAYRTLKREKFFGAKNKTSKKIIRVEDNQVFGSLQEATHAVGLKNHSSISRALSIQTCTAGGYHWRYAEKEIV